MGVITLLLISAQMQDPGTGPHFWVIATCAFAIALGTYLGGWRIIDTLGTKLTEVRPAQGLSAETSTAAAILASSHLGFALSTTQVASGSVLGSGLGRKGADVKWSTAGKIASGWLFTLPAAGAIGALAAIVANLGFWGAMADVIVATIVVLWIYLHSRKTAHLVQLSKLDTVGDAVGIRGRRAKRKAKKQAKQMKGGNR